MKAVLKRDAPKVKWKDRQTLHAAIKVLETYVAEGQYRNEIIEYLDGLDTQLLRDLEDKRHQEQYQEANPEDDNG